MELKNLTAYTLVMKQDLTDIGSVGWLLKHNKTGARVMLIENEDDLEMLFAISCADAKAILGVWGAGILGRKKSFAAQIMKLKQG